MEVLIVGDLFVSSEAFRKAIEELGEDFGPVREATWGEGKTPEDQHHVQQIMEQYGPEAVNVPEEIFEAVGDAEVMALHFAPVPKAVLEAGRNLKAVIVARAGYENVNVDAASERGIAVVNLQGRNAPAVAEQAIALMLAEARDIARADRGIRAGGWPKKFPQTPYELGGSTVGLIGSSMRSPRGFLGSVVLLLALPVAVLTQLLLGSGSGVTIHLALAVGCALLSLAVFDFETARWIALTGCGAAGAFAVIFLLQAASELIQNDSFSYFALQVLGDGPERVLKTLFIFWLVAVLLTASRDKTMILGFVTVTVVVCVEIYNYVLLFLGEAPALTTLYLLPFVWLLFESRKRALKKGRSAPASTQ